MFLLLLLLSRFSRVRLCATPWTAAYQAFPSLGFSRQEHWSGLPFPSPVIVSTFLLRFSLFLHCQHIWFYNHYNYCFGASPMAQWIKNLPAVQETQETQVRSLHQEDPLEKELATHSSLLTWEIPWTEEPGGSSPKSRIESNATKWLSRYTCIFTALIFLYANSNEWSSQSLSPWTVFFFFSEP